VKKKKIVDYNAYCIFAISELLKEMSMILTAEMVKILVPLLYHCHAAFQESSDAIPMGPYFPHRGGSKASMKNAPRHPVRPIVQMAVPHNQLDGPKVSV
jgi:hypothetical protein